MSPAPSIPPLRDLPPGRLETHHAHLLAEIRRQPWWQLRRPAITWTSRRVAGVAGVSATATAAIAAAVAVTWGGGTPSSQSTSRSVIASPRLAYVSHVSPPRPLKNRGQDYLPSAAGDSAPFSYGIHRGSRVPIAVYVLARRQAAANGDRHPTTLQWVKTTRQLAVSSQSNDRVDSPSRPVYFVVLDGRFVDKNAYYLGVGPKGSDANAPEGTVLSFTIDIKSGQILDFALANRNPDYSKIGHPHPFSFGKARGTK
jgi:hypothetical protein